MTRAPLYHNFPYDLHPDFVVLGLGRTFDVPPIPTGEDAPQGIWKLLAGEQWTEATLFTARQSNVIFAFRRDSAIAIANPEAVQFHNLVRTPPISASTQPSPMPESEIASFFVQPERQKRWCITFNGVPVASRGELEEALASITTVVEHAVFEAQVVDKLWHAQWTEDPDAVAETVMDIDPISAACVAYTPLAIPTGVVVAPPVAVEAVAASSRPVAELIIQAAAGAMLSGGMSDHFRFSESGGLIINAENPPSLTQGYEMLTRSLKVSDTGEKLKNFSSWATGSLIADLMAFFGDDFDMSEVVRMTSLAMNTLMNMHGTHVQWAHRKRERLSYTHHREVQFSTIPEEDKEWVLDQAQRLEMSVADMRKLTSYVRTYDRASLEEDLPDSREALMERLEVRSANRNFLFMLQGAWYSYRGPFEHIPGGSSQIINADNRQVLDREGRASSPRIWEPVGIQVPHARGHVAIINSNINEARADGTVARGSRGGRGVQTSTSPNPTQEQAEAAVAVIDGSITPTSTLTIEELHRVYDELHREMRAVSFESLAQTADGAQMTEGGVRYFIDEVVATEPRVIDASSHVILEDCSTETFQYALHHGLAAARRLVKNATGFPQGMPEELQALLHDARQEYQRGLIDEIIYFDAFELYMDAANEQLVPF